MDDDRNMRRFASEESIGNKSRAPGSRSMAAALQELQHLGTDHTAFMMHPPGYLASLVGLLNRGYQALKDRVVTVPTETTESPVVEEA